jgi:hypothetical protein
MNTANYSVPSEKGYRSLTSAAFDSVTQILIRQARFTCHAASENNDSKRFQIDPYRTYSFAFPVPAYKEFLAYSGRVAALDKILYVLFVASALWLFIVIRLCETV